MTDDAGGGEGSFFVSHVSGSDQLDEEKVIKNCSNYLRLVALILSFLSQKMSQKFSHCYSLTTFMWRENVMTINNVVKAPMLYEAETKVVNFSRSFRPR